MRMLKRLFAQSFELLRCLVERCIIDCSAARAGEGKISEVNALEMPELSILRKQQRPFGFRRHYGDGIL